MSTIRKLFLILFLGYYSTGITQNASIENEGYATTISSGAPTYTGASNQLVADFTTNTNQNLNVLSEVNNTTSYVLTLAENNLRIHQLQHPVRLLKIHSVEFADDIKLYNHLGQLVITQSNVSPKDNSVVLDLSQFTKGIYFVKFEKHGSIKRIRIE